MLRLPRAPFLEAGVDPIKKIFGTKRVWCARLKQSDWPIIYFEPIGML